MKKFIFYGFFIILYQFSSINVILISTFFLIGFFSDLKIIKSPNFRLIFQFIVIATFVFYNQLEIINTRIFFLDSLLEIKYFNILFVIFCILVIVNGSNFIDGVNTNVIGYYIIISTIIIYLGFTSQLFENIYKKPVKIIEVQTGNILKESDIVRYQDIYGRIS